MLLTREPGGTPLGESIRHLLKHAPEGASASAQTQLLLFAASRAQLVRDVIQPFLAEGGWVLCDRFCDSTVVFQGIAGGLGKERVEQVNRIAMGDCFPGLTLLLDIPVEESCSRLQRRSTGQKDHFDEQTPEYFKKVREGYLEICKKNPERIYALSGLESLSVVEQKIWEIVCRAFSIE